MRKTLVICLLVLLFSGSASAGEIPNWTPTPPSNIAQEQDTSATVEAGTQGSWTQGVVDLLSVLPALL
jgi:hypothetical protein